ncbi:MAG: hypothetical protein OQL09_02790 [Gammaproteobacteria bacterium]|nr:hypothetical protein [Gammaproteobacteria bacterium]
MLKILLLATGAVVCVYVYKTQNKLQSLVWQEDNHWLLHVADETLVARLIDDSFAISWLVILHFKTDSNVRCSRLVCYDSLEGEQFRQLKVRLKVEGLKHRLHAKMSS